MHGVECCLDRGFFSAVAGGYLEIVKFLYEQRPEGYFLWQTIDLAARNGFLDIVKWPHENASQEFTTSAMDGGARNNHFAMVQWLHKHLPIGCTNIAMDSAAQNGNLQLVKWLHANRKGKLSPDAMDLAAGNGHLEAVKWLDAKRPEGCTTGAMDKAAADGNLDVITTVVIGSKPIGLRAIQPQRRIRPLRTDSWASWNGFTSTEVKGALPTHLTQQQRITTSKLCNGWTPTGLEDALR
ncbi:hypothetical protein ON010_g3480 [Phytophthora cinnamomi]|nr:hypothetical protein ON010_g3480 [Phytophthora cinnamomi]